MTPAHEPRLRVVCAWCKRVADEGDPGAEETHGICEPCIREFFPDRAEAILSEVARKRAAA